MNLPDIWKYFGNIFGKILDRARRKQWDLHRPMGEQRLLAAVAEPVF